MKKFQVAGRREVAGKTAGDIVDEQELGSANIAALITGGHLVEVSGKKAEPIKESAEEVDEQEQ
jgi:hypothetical protein